MSYVELYTYRPGCLFELKPCGTGIPILGIPLEDTLSFKPGTRFATQALRSYSRFFEYTPTVDLGIDVLYKACDLGDLALCQGLLDENLRRIRLVVGETLDRWGRALLIGGEHTLTLGAARALKGLNAYIHIDAHFDCREEWPYGQRLSHATFVRRLIEELKPELVLFIGVRAYDTDEKAYVENLEDAYVITTNMVKGMEKMWLRALIGDVLSTVTGDVYLSIDVDVLDPSIMPGVGNPEGLGLTYVELYRVLEAVMDYSRPRVIDIVEYNPLADQSGIGLTHLVRLILDILNLA